MRAPLRWIRKCYRSFWGAPDRTKESHITITSESSNHFCPTSFGWYFSQTSDGGRVESRPPLFKALWIRWTQAFHPDFKEIRLREDAGARGIHRKDWQGLATRMRRFWLRLFHPQVFHRQVFHHRVFDRQERLDFVATEGPERELNRDCNPLDCNPRSSGGRTRSFGAIRSIGAIARARLEFQIFCVTYTWLEHPVIRSPE
jgi:hypothetical protein